MNEGNSEFNYDAKINQVKQIINQEIITAIEENIISDFVKEYWQSAQTILNATTDVDDKTKEIASKGREIIKTAAASNTPGARLLIGKLSEAIVLSNEQAGISQEKGNARVLRNPNAPSTILTDEDKFNMAGGFINTILIVIGTIILGLILTSVLFYI